MPRTIAVDFDGTLHTGEYPTIGKPNTPIINYIKQRKAQGDCIILWTCRVGTELSLAVGWCDAQGIVFDYVNENSAENIARYGGDSRKVLADEYIDDKAVNAHAPIFWSIMEASRLHLVRKKVEGAPTCYSPNADPPDYRCTCMPHPEDFARNECDSCKWHTHGQSASNKRGWWK